MSRQGRRRRRKKSHGFLVVFFVLVALLLAFSLSSGLFFKITDIRVEGASAYTPEQIREAAGYKLGENIMLINKTAASRNIFNNLPYVEQVKIRRELPGTVVIEIVEAAPVAMFRIDDRYWLINDAGMLLESVPSIAPPKLPLVIGMPLLAPLEGTAMGVSEKDRPKTAPLLELIKALIESDYWKEVTRIDMTALSDVRFDYAGRFTVSLGVPENISFKLELMEAAIGQFEDYQKGFLDISDDENRIVRLIPDAA